MPTRQRRAAAVAALLSPIAMAVLAAAALRSDFDTAVLAVALVLLVNAAVWFALTERALRRAVGAAVAAPTEPVCSRC